MVALGIGVLAILVSTAIVLMFGRVSARARAAATVVALFLLTFDWRMAASGALHRWNDIPPPGGLVVMTAILAAALGALLPIGRRVLNAVPLAAIVGFQGFRLPLELFMHQAAVDGVMPVQMSYSGWNFDIFTGASALAIAALIATGRASRALLIGWNLVGSILLLTIMGIAVASTPTFGAFGPDRLNTWIADPPYVWLPGILVPAAFWGHLMVWKALVSDHPISRLSRHRT